jgi:hypothetical protein
MTRKIYRTAQGRMVDLGAMQLQNENVRAVGNMKVNARGDLIDSHNRTIDSRSQQVNKQYQRQTGNVRDVPVSRKKDTGTSAPVHVDQPAPTVTDPVASVPESSGATTGLAAAIAKARQVKQEPLKSPAELAKQTPGVAKI